jgi:hypothetical protein
VEPCQISFFIGLSAVKIANIAGILSGIFKFQTENSQKGWDRNVI